MFTILPYDENIDLTKFYEEAKKRGFDNNSNQKIMIDSFRNEKEKIFFILYANGEPAGFTAGHSFDDEMGEDSYRVCTRNCVFTDKTNTSSIKNKSVITKYQNITSQFFIPKFIEWKPTSNLYITTNELESASQKQVHRIFAPLMVKEGSMSYVKEVYYRNTLQSVWQINQEVFMDQLNSYPRWA